MVETIISVTPEYFDLLPAGEQKEFFLSVTDFMKQRIGEQNILSAIVHMDETSPHMHLCFCPITKDGRLCAKDILGNAKALAKWQDDIFDHVHERWPKLERGEPAHETGRKHIPTWLFKKAQRLDIDAERIVSALSDINAFNAGKRRKQRLPLWMSLIMRMYNHNERYMRFGKRLESRRSCWIGYRKRCWRQCKG